MRHHLTDRDLVLALDGELPVRRQAAVDAHLTECMTCRIRRTELGQGGEIVTAVYRSASVDPESIATSREKLRLKLAEVSRKGEGWFLTRLVSPSAGAFRLAVGVAVVSVVLFVVAMQQFEVRLDKPIAAIEDDALPVASLTPGATWNVTVDEVCAPTGHEQRQVSGAIRAEVLRGYRMERVSTDEYELDYLITPELGGAPTVQNLWPQRYRSRTWNAHVKDQLERLLPQLICDGTITLQTAQRDIAADWIAAYKKYFHTEVPLQLNASLSQGPFGDAADDDLAYPIWRSGNSAALRLVSFSATR